MASSARSAPSSPRKDAGGSPNRLRAEIKSFIVLHLRLTGVDPASLDDDAPLVGGGLELDSIDVLELVTGIERKYGVRFEDPDLVQKVFRSVGTIASHIAAVRGET